MFVEELTAKLLFKQEVQIDCEIHVEQPSIKREQVLHVFVVLSSIKPLIQVMHRVGEVHC